VELKLAFRNLTGREREIIALVVEGKSSREIGAELGVSVKTVEAHRSNIMAKTRADDVGSSPSLPARKRRRRLAGKSGTMTLMSGLTCQSVNFQPKTPI